MEPAKSLGSIEAPDAAKRVEAMETGGRVSQEDVRRVAELAHMELMPAEQADMLRDLNSILGHVAQLNELDTRDVPAMTQVSEIPGQSSAVQNQSLRPDRLQPSLPRAEAMAAAPETDGAYFKVPKVIER